jgi:hypothetical protein
MAEFGTGGHPRKHCYTVKDISKLSGRAVGTIRNDSCAGKIDLNDLVSVFNYCIKYRKEDGEEC